VDGEIFLAACGDEIENAVITGVAPRSDGRPDYRALCGITCSQTPVGACLLDAGESGQLSGIHQLLQDVGIEAIHTEYDYSVSS